jgi:hypothetical protein
MSTLYTIWTAGDYFWIANDAVSERTDADMSIGNNAWNLGDPTVPTFIISTDDTAHEPPETYSPGAILRARTGMQIHAYALNFHGIQFDIGDGAVSGTPCFKASHDDNYSFGTPSTYRDCTFRLRRAATDCQIKLGTGRDDYGYHADTLIDCAVDFTHAGQSIRLGQGHVDWRGGSVTGTAPTTLFKGVNAGLNASADLAGLDLSLVTGNLFDGPTINAGKIRLHDSRLYHTVTPVTGAQREIPNPNIEITDCDPETHRWTYYAKTAAATARFQTVYTRDDGFSIAETPVAYQVTTTTGATAAPFPVPEFSVENALTGEVLTARVEFLHDSLTPLTNANLWLELLYPDDPDNPPHGYATTANQPPNTPTDHPASALTWADDGLTNPNPQTLEIDFTPARAGAITLRVRIAKLNYTVYLDPVATLFLADDPAPQPLPIPDFPFIMVEASDGITPMPGLEITAAVSIDGAEFTATDNAPVEVADGLYKIALTDNDLAGDWIVLRLTAADAVTQHITLQP